MLKFYDEIESNFVTWAETIEDIRAAFIVGSRARKDHPADEFSDMDIIFFTSKQNEYLTNDEWLKSIGDVRTSFVTQTAGGDVERLTLFDGGWQVDFVIHTTDSLNKIVENKMIPNNFYRGVKVILDKDHIASNIIPTYNSAPHGMVLSEELFLQSLNMFWFIVLYVAKQILRNELWVVKARDNNMKELLLQMIEWNEKTVHGWEYDTWHAGRFLCEWASEETQRELQNAFGHYDGSDSWKALMDTITLYQRLSHGIAERMNFRYTFDLEKCVLEWINEHSHP